MKHVATLPSEILITKKKQQQPETLWLTIHHKIAQQCDLDVEGLFNYYFITNLLLSLLLRNFKIGQHLAKSQTII